MRLRVCPVDTRDIDIGLITMCVVFSVGSVFVIEYQLHRV